MPFDCPPSFNLATPSVCQIRHGAGLLRMLACNSSAVRSCARAYERNPRSLEVFVCISQRNVVPPARACAILSINVHHLNCKCFRTGARGQPVTSKVRSPLVSFSLPMPNRCRRRIHLRASVDSEARYIICHGQLLAGSIHQLR